MSLEVIFSMLVALSIAFFLYTAILSPSLGFVADSRAIGNISNTIGHKAAALSCLCGPCPAGGG